MKLDCGKRGPERKQKARRRRLHWWHRWFAWYPVRLGEHDCRWLEFVERRGKLHVGWEEWYWEWEHRACAENLRITEGRGAPKGR